MVRSSYPHPLDQFPTDLLQAVAQHATADAERVVRFLDALGLRATRPETDVPSALPTFFLIGLGATLRLLVWEEAGLHAHRDAGLPSAQEALREVAQWVITPQPRAAKERAANELTCRVLAVLVERLA